MNSMANNMPLSTPLDVRRGITRATDVAFPLRWGILGAGNISAQWVWALHACEGATVTAVAAREIDRAKEFARQYGVATAYGDYREMVTADDEILYTSARSTDCTRNIPSSLLRQASMCSARNHSPRPSLMRKRCMQQPRRRM